jgi:hypothetical protein
MHHKDEILLIAVKDIDNASVLGASETAINIIHNDSRLTNKLASITVHNS